ncbi:MAG: hypothetical protein LBR85_04775 [Oscillospiraceae bacterium]|nr:hypothetical protein [Oscillospiraceae bacterium]
MTTTGASGAIPRGDWTRMDSHAISFYEEIRKRTSDVSAISRNIGMPETDISAVKMHVFFNEYFLGEDAPRRFDPSYDMAVSWQRLADGNNIQEMDMVMLRHELLELKYMATGMPYAEAHRLANEQYNYERYTDELDRKAGLK